MFENERHLAGTYFQHRTRALAAGTGISEAGVEEARVVHAEFTHQRIERHHFRGIVRGHLHGLLRGQNVELAGIENETAVGSRGDGLPELTDRIAATTVD